MNKKIIGIICAVAVVSCGILAFFLFGWGNNKTLTDAERFSKDYSGVGEENVFVYRDASQIVNILERGTGVVFFGFPECPWCQSYVPILNEVALDMGITEIYYCNIREDRSNDTEAYQRIVELLGEELDYDNEGNHRLFVPDVTVVKNGEIMGHNNDTSMLSEDKDGKASEYWTKDRKAILVATLETMFEEIIDADCTSCE